MMSFVGYNLVCAFNRLFHIRARELQKPNVASCGILESSTKKMGIYKSEAELYGFGGCHFIAMSDMLKKVKLHKWHQFSPILPKGYLK